jgi:hypothetical protein
MQVIRSLSPHSHLPANQPESALNQRVTSAWQRAATSISGWATVASTILALVTNSPIFGVVAAVAGLAWLISRSSSPSSESQVRDAPSHLRMFPHGYSQPRGHEPRVEIGGPPPAPSLGLQQPLHQPHPRSAHSPPHAIMGGAPPHQSQVRLGQAPSQILRQASPPRAPIRNAPPSPPDVPRLDLSFARPTETRSQLGPGHRPSQQTASHFGRAAIGGLPPAQSAVRSQPFGPSHRAGDLSQAGHGHETRAQIGGAPPPVGAATSTVSQRAAIDRRPPNLNLELIDSERATRSAPPLRAPITPSPDDRQRGARPPERSGVLQGNSDRATIGRR